jgi:hypothetical protein
MQTLKRIHPFWHLLHKVFIYHESVSCDYISIAIHTETKENKTYKSGSLTSTEIGEAEHTWIIYVQRNHYADIFTSMHLKKRSNLQSQLNLYVDALSRIKLDRVIETSYIAPKE